MESTTNKKNKAILQMVICSIMWSAGGILIKNVQWNPFVIAGARGMVAAVVIIIYLKLNRISFVFSKKTVLTGLFTSLTCVCFVAANKLTTAANAIVLQFTAPVFIMVFSVLFFKRRFSRADVMAVLLTLIGISLFFFDQITPGRLFGNFLSIFAGVCMAWMFIMVGEIGAETRVSAILIAQLITIIISLPFFVITPPELEIKPVICILVLGALQQAIPYILYARASVYCPPLACSLLGALEPLLNPVWVFMFDGEAPGTFALMGGVVVIATVTLWCLKGNKAEQPQPVG